MRKSIYLLTTTPSSHTHRFHPLPLATPTSCSPHPLATPIHSTHSTIVIHTFNLCKVQSLDDNCGEWVECMGVVSGSGWNLWVWLLGVVVRRYIDFLILLIVYRVSYIGIRIIESVDTLQYITNAGISRARYTITLFIYHHHGLRLISNRISV